MGLSKQEYWSGLPFPPPGDTPDAGIELTYVTSVSDAGIELTYVTSVSCIAGRFFTH